MHITVALMITVRRDTNMTGLKGCVGTSGSGGTTSNHDGPHRRIKIVIFSVAIK